MSMKAAARSPTLLLVEDDPFQRRLLTAQLESAGFEVETVLGAADALAILKEEEKSFDAVIADFHMPEVNGVELLAQMRAEGYKTPFYLISGDDLVAHEALKAGADGFLKKPFRVERLALKLWLCFKSARGFSRQPKIKQGP